MTRGDRMKDWLSRKVRFVKATLESDSEMVRASVELQRSTEGSYVGRAERPSQGVDILLAGAQAAAEAVAQAAAVDGAQVEVKDVARVQVFGEDVVIVQVTASFRGQVRSLFGVCHLGDDPAEAAALAVLNATNRVYDLA